MNNSTYVINTFSYIWERPVDTCVSHLAAQGYRRLEILLSAPHLWPYEFSAAARRTFVGLTRSLGVEVVSINAGGFDNNLVSPAKDARAFALNYLAEVIDLAGDIDAGLIVISPGVARPLIAPPREWLLGWFLDGMEHLVQRAQRRNVRLLLENIPFSFLPRAEDLMFAIRDLPESQVGIVYDVANAVFVRENPMAGLLQVASRLHLIHLSDTSLETWAHLAVGQGVVPFTELGAALQEISFQGPNVLEIVSREPDHDIAHSVDELRRLGW